MIEIDLPRLVGSRSAASALVAAYGSCIKGERVVVNCRDLRSATPSFVDELVKRVLVEGEAAELVVLGGDEDFLRYVHDSAQAHDVDERVTERPAGSEIDA